jgi:lipopolysaccharide heptosyltransferase I
VKRILLIKPSSLGDIIHTLPLVHAIRRCLPDSSLGWVVQDSFKELLERDQAIDAIYPISIASTSDPEARKSAYLRAFNDTIASLFYLRRNLARSYDIVLDLHASFRSALLGITAAGGQRIGFKDARELNTFFQHRLIAVPGSIEHALEKNLLFAQDLGCVVSNEDFYINSNDKDDKAVSELLNKLKVPINGQLVYAHSSARWQTKFWPKRHWALLADLLAKQGKTVVFAGSRSDLPFINSITEQMETHAVVTAGKLTLPESIALLKRSCLYVGLDSGPMHMAALASVPVVALFGPTHPSRVGPYNVGHRIVRVEELDCLECRKRNCDHLSCMKMLSPGMVIAAIADLLSE